MGALIAIPGYLAIDWLMPDWMINGVDKMCLIVKVVLVVTWTACAWIAVALRSPSVVDGGDLELRTQWAAYLPKWIRNHIAK